MVTVFMGFVDWLKLATFLLLGALTPHNFPGLKLGFVLQLIFHIMFGSVLLLFHVPREVRRKTEEMIYLLINGNPSRHIYQSPF